MGFRPLQRGSWLRNAKQAVFEDEENGVQHAFYDIAQLPVIQSRDDDLLHTVTAEDRIDRLAYTAYGDHRLWWVIAQANDFESAWTGLAPGSTIRIPSPRYVRETLAR